MHDDISKSFCMYNCKLLSTDISKAALTAMNGSCIQNKLWIAY